MINNWIKIAFRNYRKNFLFTLINVLGLTIGMIGVLLVALFWNDELSYNQWNPHKNEIYSVAHEFDWSEEKVFQSISTVPEGPAIKESFSEVADVLIASNYLATELVQSENTSFYKEGILKATTNFFAFFPFQFIEGSGKSAIENLQSVAISETWKKELFGDEPALNKKLKIGNEEFVVRGVYSIPGKSSISPEAVLNIDWNTMQKEYGDNGGIYMVSLYLKLKPGTNSAELAERIHKQIVIKYNVEPFAKKQNITVQEYIEKNGNYSVSLDKLADLRLFAKGSGGAGARKGDLKLLNILTGVSILILVISAFNYMNLTLASSLKRAKEVGIRKTLGGTSKNLILQFILENAILCLFSLVLALAISELILPFFNEFVNKDLQLSESGFFLELFLILVLIILFSGILPALYLAKFKPLKVLKGDFSRSRSGIWIRNFMLGLQFIISGFFLISGIIMFLQVSYMLNKDLGFKGEQLVAVSLEGVEREIKYEKYKLIKQEFKKIKGVEDITTGFQIPRMFAYMGGPVNLPENGASIGMALLGAMDYNFIDMLGLEILEGRNISPKYASDTITNVLVNETFVKQLGIDKPIGKEFFFNSTEQNHTIIGVVKDYIIDGFQSKVEPTVYFHFNEIPFTKNQFYNVLFKINADDMNRTLQAIEEKWKKEIIPSGYPFTYKFVDEEFAKSYKEFQVQQRLFSIMTLTAIIIALLGLFGLVSFSIEQQMKEISIRKVLGASQTNIFQLIGKQYLWVNLISLLFTIPITYYLMAKWLEDFAYRIDMPIIPYVIGAFLLLILSITVIYIRISFALKTNPVNYLKYE